MHLRKHPVILLKFLSNHLRKMASELTKILYMAFARTMKYSSPLRSPHVLPMCAFLCSHMYLVPSWPWERERERERERENVCLYVCINTLTFYMFMCVPQHMCRRQRTTCGHQFSPSTIWVSGMKPKASAWLQPLSTESPSQPHQLSMNPSSVSQTSVPDMANPHINSQQLWLPVQNLHKILPDKIPAWVGDGNSCLHP